MDVPRRFQQVRVLLAKNGLVPVLKEVPVAPVPSVEIHHVSGQQLAHAMRQGTVPGSNQKVKMRVQQSPGINMQSLRFTEDSDSIQEVLAIAAGPEDLASFNSSPDHMMQCPGRIQPWLSWHDRRVC